MALQTRAGCEVLQHVCQGMPGILCQPPLLPGPGESAVTPHPYSAAKGSSEARAPQPSTAGHLKSHSPSGCVGGALGICRCLAVGQ